MQLLKKIGLWYLVVLFAAIALVTIPSFSCIFAALIIGIILPVTRWQSFISRFVHGKVRLITVIVLIILMFATFPAGMLDTDTTIPDDSTSTASTESTSSQATNNTTHIHQYNNATCTTPKTCNTCGATTGSAAGHSWQNATCTSPKTCKICGTTSGSASAHYYQNGKCTNCGKSDPNYSTVVKVWIPTNGGTKYHTKSSCSSMKDPVQVTKDEAISRGFTACQRCH